MNDINTLEALQATSIKSKKYLNSKCANALRGMQNGPYITLDDVAQLEHKIPVTVSSKNLFDLSNIPSITNLTNTGNSLVIANAQRVTQHLVTLREICPSLKVGDIVTLSFVVENPDGVFNDNGLYIYLLQAAMSWNNLKSLTITEAHLNSNIVFCTGGYPQTHTDAEIYDIQIEYGIAPTSYTPYVSDDEDIVLNISGKNLLPVNKVEAGIDNDKVVFSGALTGDFVFSYTLNLEATNSATIFQYTVDGVTYNTTKWQTKYSFSGTLTKIVFLNWIGVTEGSIDDIQLETGTIATEFEPYQESFVVTTSTNETMELSSFPPNMSITPDRSGVLIEAEYNKDPNKVIDALVKAIISLGGTI